LENCTVLVETVDAHPEDDKERVRASCKNVIQEEDEMFLSIEPDTVIHPWAMMVHSSDTVSAG